MTKLSIVINEDILGHSHLPKSEETHQEQEPLAEDKARQLANKERTRKLGSQSTSRGPVHKGRGEPAFIRKHHLGNRPACGGEPTWFERQIRN